MAAGMNPDPMTRARDLADAGSVRIQPGRKLLEPPVSRSLPEPVPIASMPPPPPPTAVAARIPATSARSQEVKIASAAIANIDEPISPEELANLAPAAGVEAPDAHIPRPPPDEGNYEKEYVSVPFDPGIYRLSNALEQQLDGKVLGLLRKNPGWRLQIQAFASSTQKEADSARRTSLSRALSVRTYLLDKGIDASRMDVRALGAQTNRKPADRVDLVFFDPAID
jgi:outer membrane protein OmpA-like peptidoglycan-associated protein